MRLADSKIFRGDDSTLDPKEGTRSGRSVYVLAAHKDGTKAWPFVSLSGWPSHLNLVRNALDNLTITTDSNRKLPAFIAIGVENGGADGKSERGSEYDTLSDRFARFINDEVLPAVRLRRSKCSSEHLSLHRIPGKGVIDANGAPRVRRWVGFRPTIFAV